MVKGTIFYIGFFGLPDKDAAAHRVLNNAKALRELGYDVVFIDEQDKYEYQSIEESKRIIQGFDVFSLKRPDNNIDFFKKMTSISQQAKIIDLYPDTLSIIAYNYPAVALHALRKYCLKKKIKVISDCTEWYSGNEYRFPMNILAKADSFYRMRIVNKKMDGIICISSYLNEYYKKTNNTIIIPPLVDLSEEIWNQETVELGRGINLVYCGNPGRAKDQLKPVVEAVSCVSNTGFTLRVIGITKEQYIAINGALPKNSDNILFLGRIAHDKAVAIVKSSDYLVFLRDRNRVSMAGFSTKFVEAVSCGTQVITTDTSDLKQYIEKYNLGIIINADEKIVLDESRMHKKNCSQINGLFDYHNYIQKFDQWILENFRE